jgi:UDP-N-acetyl-D-galactosamine dehydrogenase
VTPDGQGLQMDLTDKTIAIIGLGYVGLPLAVEFGKKRPVIGFDIRSTRVAELREGIDTTREVDADELRQAEYLSYSSDPEDLASCGVFIAAVPTPVDAARRPYLTLIEKAATTIGRAMKKGAVVVFE